MVAALRTHPLTSRALLGFRAYLSRHAGSETFLALRGEVAALTADLAAVVYDVQVFGGSFRVERHAGDPDYGAEVEGLFAKFRQTGDGGTRVAASEPSDMNHVEATILKFVARLHPALFARLVRCAAAARDAIDPTLRRVDREMQFYLSYLEAVAPLRRRASPFCLPAVSSASKATSIRDGYDLALAMKLVRRAGAS